MPERKIKDAAQRSPRALELLLSDVNARQMGSLGRISWYYDAPLLNHSGKQREEGLRYHFKACPMDTIDQQVVS